MARKIKDSGWKRSFKRATRKKVTTAGVHQKDDSRGEELGNAQVGFWQEFGTARIPQRSFMRSTFDENEREYRKFFKTALRNAAEGKMSANQALAQVGLKIAADIKAKIRSSVPPPNALRTVRKKGSSVTLIDTAQLLNSIDSEVS